MGRKGRLFVLAARVVLACSVASSSAWGVSGCSAEVERSTASFALAELSSCPIEGLQTRTLSVAGDFPTRRSDVFGPDETPMLDAMPIDARAVSIDAQLARGRAAALAPLDADATQPRSPLLLMPLDVSCPIGDTLVAAAPGAAIAATDAGSLLVAGGQAGDRASLRSVVVMARASELGRQVEGGLLLPRAFASATAIEGGVLIAGGGAGEGGPAHDTFEIYDASAERLRPPQRWAGGGRRNHGAARLPDGRVLLVGGVSGPGGAALTTAELIDPESGSALELDAPLQDARVDPSVLVLDDGSVLVLLGRESDAASADLVTGVERLGSARGEGYRPFERVASLPSRTVAAVTALEGGRVAYLGCGIELAAEEPEEPEEPRCEVSLLVPDGGSRLQLLRDVIEPEVLGAAMLREPSSLRLSTLRDGKLLATARAGGAAAWLIDLTRGEVESDPDATRVPDQLVALADGSIAELDAFGTSLRRHDATSAFHDAPDSLLSPDALTPDRPERASFGEDVVAAEGGPLRLDLPFLRFGRLRVELTLSGQGRVLLEPAGAPATAIELGKERIAIGDCELARSDASEPVVIERRGPELTLRAGDARRSCSEPALEGLLGLALQLEDGARLHALRVERR